MMEGFAFPVEVVRTNRTKNAALRIKAGRLIIKVPRSLPESHVRQIIIERLSWIEAELKEYWQRPTSIRREYVDGEVFPYLGQNYELKVVEGGISLVRIENDRLVATVPDADADPHETIKPLLKDWYWLQAEMQVWDMVKQLSLVVGVRPAVVSVRDYKNRLSGCTAHRMYFNWKLIFAPPHIIESAVLHELYYFREYDSAPNHWEVLERHAPERVGYWDWVKENRHLFTEPVI